MKQFLQKIWFWAFPFRQIYEWGLELFYVRVHNGDVHHEKSSTKAFRTMIGFAALAFLFLIGLAFWVKLGGSLAYFMKLDAKVLAQVRESLTAGILASFVSLGGLVGTLFTFLQSNYSKHKAGVIKHVKESTIP